jgi:hypothetical protein
MTAPDEDMTDGEIKIVFKEKGEVKRLLPQKQVQVIF